MAKFRDVKVIVPVGELPPFPKSISEVNQQYLDEVYSPRVAPLIVQAIEEVKPLGYGAICTASFGDIGVGDLGSRGESKVVGLGWSNFHAALSGYGRFSLIHPYTPDIAWYFEDLVDRYDMSDHCVSIETYDVDLSEVITIGVRPDIDQVIDLTVPCVKRAVDKGAEVVLIGCGGQFWSWFAPVLSEITVSKFGVEVLPPIDTMFDFARKLIADRTAP